MKHQFADRDIEEIWSDNVAWSKDRVLHVNFLFHTYSTYYTREDLQRMLDILDGKDEGIKICP